MLLLLAGLLLGLRLVFGVTPWIPFPGSLLWNDAVHVGQENHLGLESVNTPAQDTLNGGS